MSGESVYRFKAKKIDGAEVSFREFSGKALLVVNVASHCGFTNQYEGLEALYRKFNSAGLEVLGFPCNQFGAQEPGDENEIKNFCKLKYDVTFPMFAKVDVNGPAAHPLFQFLKSEKKGVLFTEAIKWNFTKFLIDKKGQVLKRYAPNVKPEDLENDIRVVLG